MAKKKNDSSKTVGAIAAVAVLIIIGIIVGFIIYFVVIKPEEENPPAPTPEPTPTPPEGDVQMQIVKFEPGIIGNLRTSRIAGAGDSVWFPLPGISPDPSVHLIHNVVLNYKTNKGQLMRGYFGQGISFTYAIEAGVLYLVLPSAYDYHPLYLEGCFVTPSGTTVCSVGDQRILIYGGEYYYSLVDVEASQSLVPQITTIPAGRSGIVMTNLQGAVAINLGISVVNRDILSMNVVYTGSHFAGSDSNLPVRLFFGNCYEALNFSFYVDADGALYALFTNPSSFTNLFVSKSGNQFTTKYDMEIYTIKSTGANLVFSSVPAGKNAYTSTSRLDYLNNSIDVPYWSNSLEEDYGVKYDDLNTGSSILLQCYTRYPSGAVRLGPGYYNILNFTNFSGELFGDMGGVYPTVALDILVSEAIGQKDPRTLRDTLLVTLPRP